MTAPPDAKMAGTPPPAELYRYSVSQIKIRLLLSLSGSKEGQSTTNSRTLPTGAKRIEFETAFARVSAFLDKTGELQLREKGGNALTGPAATSLAR